MPHGVFCGYGHHAHQAADQDARLPELPEARAEVRVWQAHTAAERLMPEIGGVYYDGAAFEHMQRLAVEAQTSDERRRAEIGNEAAVIHAFHEEFPGGIVMHDVATLDRAAARAATEEAIERVDRAADPDWKDRALEVVHAICKDTAVFTPDNIWERIEKPREPRALGPVMLRARRNGWCEPTGQFVKSQATTQHQNPITEYRSLLA